MPVFDAHLIFANVAPKLDGLVALSASAVLLIQNDPILFQRLGSVLIVIGHLFESQEDDVEMFEKMEADLMAV